MMKYLIAALLCCLLSTSVTEAGLILRSTSGGSSGVPVNTGAPTLSGTATVGSTLTCSNGTWTNSPTSFSYNFIQDGTTSQQSGSSTTYVVVSGNAGHSLTCVVTATNGSGSSAPSPASNSISIPGAGIAHVQDGFSSNCSGSTTCAATVTGATTGNFFIAGVMTNTVGSTAATISSVTTSNATTCTQATNAQASFLTGGEATNAAIFYCQNITGGSVTLTAHASLSPSLTFVVFAHEFSGVSTTGADIGAGATVTRASGGTTNIFQNVTATQTNQLIYSCAAHDDSPGTISVPPPQILIAGDPPESYQITNSVGAVGQTISWTAASAGFVMASAIFGHP